MKTFNILFLALMCGLLVACAKNEPQNPPNYIDYIYENQTSWRLTVSSYISEYENGKEEVKKQNVFIIEPGESHTLGCGASGEFMPPMSWGDRFPRYGDHTIVLNGETGFRHMYSSIPNGGLYDIYAYQLVQKTETKVIMKYVFTYADFED